MRYAIKQFEFEEGSIEDMSYRIVVKFRGQVVEEFIRPTMREAVRDFELAGYKQVGKP